MYVTYLLIGINAVVYLLIMTQNLDVNKFIYNQQEIKYNKEWYRMITSGFMHMAIFHIAFNMYALYSFGLYLEQSFQYYFGPDLGRIIYLLVYILSILGGSVYCYFAKSREANYLALGASGGVFGIVYIAVLMSPEIGIGLFLIPVPIAGWILGIIITLGSIILSLLPRAGNVSHEGHLGGALSGVLIMFILFSLLGAQFAQKSLYFMYFGVLPAAIYLIAQVAAPAKVDDLRNWFQEKLPKGDD